jgi:NMT1/THI5 like
MLPANAMEDERTVDQNVKMLGSDVSHLPLLRVWQQSGVTERYGFELTVHVTNAQIPGQEFMENSERAPRLLNGTYDFLSGLHHEPYQYRARGDKRFVYLAQAQNDWDDRVIVRDEIRSVQDLEGKKLIYTTSAPCVLGNLRHSLEVGGADLSRIEFTTLARGGARADRADVVRVLAAGEAAAASVDCPYDRMGEKVGLHRLEIPSIPVIHNATICSNREWVAEHEDTTLAFLRSMIDAIHFFKTEKSQVCAILEEHVGPIIGVSAADEIEHLQETWASLLSPKPFPHPLAVWNVYNLDVAHDPAVNFIGPFEIWDTSLLRQIDDSGFIDELYGGAAEAVNPAVNVAI